MDNKEVYGRSHTDGRTHTKIKHKNNEGEMEVIVHNEVMGQNGGSRLSGKKLFWCLVVFPFSAVRRLPEGRTWNWLCPGCEGSAVSPDSEVLGGGPAGTDCFLRRRDRASY